MDSNSSVRIHLRDCMTMKYQNSDFCANCYQQLAEHENKKFTDQIETFRNGQLCQRGVTVGQAIVVLFDVIRKSHLSPIILDEDAYKLCQNCYNILSQLYIFFEEFTNCSTPPSYLFSFVRTNRVCDTVLTAEIKSEPGDVYPDYDQLSDVFEQEYMDDMAIHNLNGSSVLFHSDVVDGLDQNKPAQSRHRTLDYAALIDENCKDSQVGQDETSSNCLDIQEIETLLAETDSEEFNKIDVDKPQQKLRKRTHICPDCNMGFTRSNHLRRHALLHSAKEFTCDCGVGFRAKRNLQYHLKYNCPDAHTSSAVSKKSIYATTTGEKVPVDKSARIKQAAKLVRIAKKSKSSKLTTKTTVATTVHNQDSHLVCSLTVCGKVFNSQYKLRRHEAIHVVKPFTCQHCHQSYRTEELLSNHLNSYCKVFNDKSTDATTKSTHKEAETDEDGPTSKLLKSVKQSKPNASSKVLKRVEQRKSNNSKRYACHCGASFSRTNHLHDHSLVHRESNVRCEQCNAGFISQAKLDKHKKVVHDPDYEKRVHAEVSQVLSLTGKVVDIKVRKKVRESNAKEDCKVCGKSIRARNMRIHLVSHSETRPAVCELCGLSFKLYWSLKCHQKYAHGDHRPFLCRYCGAAFKRNQHLLDHEVVKHSDARLYICEEPGCSKTFKSSRNLRQHRHLHQGVKYPCPECGKIFSRKDNLKVHRDKSCRLSSSVEQGQATMEEPHQSCITRYIPTTVDTRETSNSGISVVDATKGGWQKRPKDAHSRAIRRFENKSRDCSSSLAFNSTMTSALTSSHFLYAAQTPGNIINGNANTTSFLLPVPAATTSVFNTASSTGLVNPVMFDLDFGGKL